MAVEIIMIEIIMIERVLGELELIGRHKDASLQLTGRISGS